jgi:hypothetical protein
MLPNMIIMTFRTILALILAIWWLIGSVLPIIPGVILSLIAMLIIEFVTPAQFSSQIRIISIILMIAAMVSDYLLPIWWAKKWGGTVGSKYGSIIWLIVWLFVPPRGLIIWPLLGAFVGEYIIHQDSRHALRAAWGSFVWSFLSSVIKLVATWVILYYVIQQWL